MATVEQCQVALHRLAEQLSANGGSHSDKLDRTLTCTVPDLGVVFGGRLHGGALVDVAQTQSRAAQIKLTLDSDDLLRLVDGELKVASAWASGRLKIEAGVMDLLRLKSMF